MSLRDYLMALAVITTWGLNFVVIKIGLRDVPPFLLGFLRFLFVVFPAVLWIPRPRVPWPWVVAYGAAISFGQFAFLFLALAVGMPAGLASLVLQTQVFFTLALSALAFGDRLGRANVLGLLVAVLGLVLLGEQSIGLGHDFAGTPVPWIGLLLTVAAAFSWACGNVISKRIATTELVNLVVWGGMVALLPFALLSLYLEGVSAIRYSLTHLSLAAVLTIVYLAVMATLLGYTLWGRLLNRLPTSTVAPLTLLVPVVGLSSAWLILDETLSWMQAVGIAVILLGLLINVRGQQWSQWTGRVWRKICQRVLSSGTRS